MLEDYFREMEIVPATIMEVASIGAIKELVKLGLGVSVLAPWAVHHELARGGLTKLKGSFADLATAKLLAVAAVNAEQVPLSGKVNGEAEVSFINSAPAFLEGPKVMNGASDLMVEVFADKGRHARSTVGVASLPLDAAVEVEGLFEVA